MNVYAMTPSRLKTLTRSRRRRGDMRGWEGMSI
jgi:hypothetical protein